MVLFVVQKGERNSFDQRWLEYALWETHNLATVRLSLSQVQACGELRGPRRQLFVQGRHVAVVYFRAGYTPEDYPSEAEWAARTLLERSLAVKCPSIQVTNLKLHQSLNQRTNEPKLN